MPLPPLLLLPLLCAVLLCIGAVGSIATGQRHVVEHERKRLGFWLVPGGADSPRSEACEPPLVNTSSFVFDWSSLDGLTAAAMARCGAAGVKNFLRLDLGPHRGSRRSPTIETPYMYHSPVANPSATGCPPYSPYAHNDWATQPPVCCRVPNGTRCGSGTFPCCNTAAPSVKSHPCSPELPQCVWEPGLRLLDNFTAVWKSWLPTIKQLHSSHALHGVFLGDELLLAGLPLSNLSSLADLIRADFPRTASTEADFTIYENDAYSPIKGGVDGLNRPINWEDKQTPASPWRVPSSLDWISMVSQIVHSWHDTLAGFSAGLWFMCRPVMRSTRSFRVHWSRPWLQTIGVAGPL
eukprot:COSAG02_NODE_55_length_43887_cov_30.660364_50_plen_351_part_00